MQLFHFSDKDDLTLDKLTFYPGEKNHVGKPRGLWVTPDSDDNWESFCREDGFELHKLNFKYEVFLHKENILFINDFEGLHNFNDRFKGGELCDPSASSFWLSNPWLRCLDEIIPRDDHFSPFEAPDWKQVSSLYDGLVIAPHLKTGVSDIFWYRYWDCASGIIWNANAIESISLVRKAIK